MYFRSDVVKGLFGPAETVKPARYVAWDYVLFAKTILRAH